MIWACPPTDPPAGGPAGQGPLGPLGGIRSGTPITVTRGAQITRPRDQAMMFNRPGSPGFAVDATTGRSPMAPLSWSPSWLRFGARGLAVPSGRPMGRSGPRETFVIFMPLFHSPSEALRRF